MGFEKDFSDKIIKVGIIGLGQRGAVLLGTIMACDEAKVTALCDLYDDRVQAAQDRVIKKYGEKPATYSDFHLLVDDENVDVVLISAAWEVHVDIAVESMEKGKIVALEVGGAYRVSDCWRLVDAYERTGTPIMMMENCCWDRFELLSTSLVRNGVLGEVVHCHGAYSHDLRDEILGGIVNRHYRLRNYRERNCDNYPTHELGPIAKILDVNRGNKLNTLVSVSCKAAGLEAFEYSDMNPDKSLIGCRFKQGDIVSTMITCENGETITLTLDTTLPKYYSREFTVRGTKGLCNQEANMVFVDGVNDSHEFFDPEKTIGKYINNAEEYSEYQVEEWRNITDKARTLGHGGMDYLMIKAFFKAVKTGSEMPVDVYDTATWMSVTALSEISIAEGGAPQEFPDFTRGRWKERPRLDVTEFPVVSRACGNAEETGDDGIEENEEKKVSVG